MDNEILNISSRSVELKSNDLYFLYVRKNTQKGITGYKWHEHTFFEMLFYAEGETEYVIENRSYKLKGGDVLFIKPGYHHFEHNVIKTPSTLYCLGFMPESIENGELAEKIFENGEIFSLKTDSPIFDMLNAAAKKLELSKNNARYFVKAIAESVVLFLNDLDIKGTKATEIKNGTVQKMLDYIKNNLCEIQKVSDISKALFFSDSYTRTLFKKEMGIGITEYVRNKKVLLAHRKIKQGRKPTEVYAECGFSNYPSFYRAYLAYFGYTPKTKSN